MDGVCACVLLLCCVCFFFCFFFCYFFFFNDTATTEIYTLSLHDALPISCFSVLELKVPTVHYLEMGGSIVFLFRN